MGKRATTRNKFKIDVGTTEDDLFVIIPSEMFKNILNDNYSVDITQTSSGATCVRFYNDHITYWVQGKIGG